MKGWNIFAHSVKLVLRNIVEALQIGLVPSVLMAVVVTVLIMQSGLPMNALTDETALSTAIEEGRLNYGLLILIPIVWGVTTLWIFVSWHRFVLLEEYPRGWIPPFLPDRILAYFGRLLMLMVLAFLVLMVAGLLAAFLGGLGVVLLFATIAAMAVAFYRFSVILPAAAIGRHLTLRDALDATAGSAGAIIVLIVLLFVMQVVLQLIFGVALAILPVLGIAAQVITSLIVSLVNVSILTTLYGHYVENRPID